MGNWQVYFSIQVLCGPPKKETSSYQLSGPNESQLARWENEFKKDQIKFFFFLFILSVSVVLYAGWHLFIVVWKCNLLKLIYVK